MRKQMAFGGFAITFAGAVLFSTKAIIVKKAFADTGVDALTLLTLRMIFSLPFFLGAAFFVGRKTSNLKLTRKQWAQICLLGIFGYYLSAYFDFTGLQYISAGLERLVLFLFPTLVVLMNRLFFGMPISRVQLAALVLTYSGIGIAYYDEMHLEHGNAYFFTGSLFILLCAVTYALYICGSGRLIPKVGATRFTAYAMLASTAGIFAHYIIRADYTAVNAAAGMWEYGILIAIVATVLPTFMLSAGLSRIGSNNVAIISAVGPVSTILQAHWILGERINSGQIAGTLLVIAGVLLTGWKSEETG